ncbi:MAG: 16S rRNA (cytidine(1402)-2'-O)-methyltransferase [Rickettsiales bacterium]|nr:16S rRNA (cytidine(1402)-2'-O)-methyltransferase [Rickettsiales bacterium]|tara:strand:+ start:1096 stop:1977 length:882 start_codon:yes stop_codon:yes gene_type:complete
MLENIVLNKNSKDINFEKGLYIIATPIGNKNDITIRSFFLLSLAKTVICEDTRVTKNLFKLLKISSKNKNWISYNDHSQTSKRNKILTELTKNKIVCLVSDAGTPLISDPGYKLIQLVRKHGHNIYSIPGPSSVISSLVVSGLQTDKFTFLGFLPKNKNNYIKILRDFSITKSSLILFEKSNRLSFFLTVLKANFFSFKLAIVRELTKIYEEIILIDQDNIDDFIKKKVKLKGEITIVLEIFNYKFKIYSDKELLKELKSFKPSQVSAMISKKSSENREKIYKRCINLLNKEK